MRNIVSLVFLIGFGFSTIAQSNHIRSVNRAMRLIPDSSVHSVQGIANYINSRFSGQSDQSHAIFIWIAKNFRYDTDNMFAKNTYINHLEVIDKMLKTRKGLCFDYAVLFNEIARKLGIKSYLVSGYTKENGVIDTLPHSWCVALIDSKWVMFDPTWGSGEVQKSRFIKKTNYFYYKTRPQVMIASHMPYDPLWQLLDYPVLNSAFYDETQSNAKNPYFNFQDSISVYEKQSDVERLIASNYRIEKNSIKNPLILKQLENNRKEIAYLQRKKFEFQFNVVVESSNNANNLMNQFIGYFNKKFIPAISDDKIQHMIDTVETCLTNTRKQLITIYTPDANAALLTKQLNETMNKITLVLNEHKAFLRKYFNTSQEARIYLFYTWKSQ